ncbi:hypothetical protein ACFYO1_40970 [Nocardia sp. NPDC006044]|uniref:hypothetical protein n=1 Tax=Nocardia sp. NPDC006044 TaxID=3364306 RepID=UPI00368266D6
MTVHLYDDNDGFDADEIDAALRLRSVRLLIDSGANGWDDEPDVDDQMWAA